MIFANANEEYRYREQTHKKTNSIPPVEYATFKCASCKEFRPRKGMKEVLKGHPRFGYRCAKCLEGRK